ncbi:MAG: TlpA disulfide reductase family protein [Burkholderiaceae bacterium]|jgi:thiol-disulfide isomerase/thioredoxin|nr:TlpA disulfide reductase family protein [Burkholderiaceae bacterium]
MKRSSRITLISAVLFAAMALGVIAYLQLGPTVPLPTPAAAAVNTKIDIEGLHFVHWAQPRQLRPLSFKDETGARVSLADFQGRVILLNVWATWCPPCREEMPALDRLSAKRQAAGFAVVTLSLDAPSAAKAFLKGINARTLTAYTDAEGMALRVLGVSTVPSTILIDRKGRELGGLSGATAWDSGAALALIDDALKEPTCAPRIPCSVLVSAHDLS